MTKQLAAELIQAYTETNFIVHAEPPFTLKIGTQSSALVQLFDKTNVLCAAFITACNPFSESLPAHKNHEFQKILQDALTKRSLKFINGIGQHPSGNWPGEPSFLVLDLDLAAARVLARYHKQNAFVWCGQDGMPELVIT
jgi:hypothetical protein